MSIVQIEFNHIYKKYRNYVLKDFSYIIDNLKYNFIIGKNGSGKSTLIKCLFNLVNYKGNIKFDKDINLIYVPEKVFLPDYIKMIYFIKLLTQKEISEINSLLMKFNIEKYQNEYIYNLSLGTKQKMMLISGLLKSGDGYVFDEPLNGLDENSILVFIDCLKQLMNEEKLIIIVSHRLNNYDFNEKRIIDIGYQND